MNINICVYLLPICVHLSSVPSSASLCMIVCGGTYDGAGLGVRVGGGLRLHYLDWGNGGAPPLVLLHDLGQSADAWQPVAPALAERFHVIAVDMRGHGDSDWIDTYSPQEQGDDIGELVGVLGLQPAAVMGSGMGGRAAMLLAELISKPVETRTPG